MTLNQWVALASEMLGVIAVTMLLTISPRFKQMRPLVFRYPRREGTVSLVLFAGLFLIAFLVHSGQLSVTGFAPAGASAGLVSLYQQAALALVGVLTFGAALVYRRQPVRSAGWNRALLTPALQVAIAIVLLSIFLRGMFPRLIAGLNPEQSGALPVILILALAEESVFRGYIQLRLSGWLGNIPGWLAASGLFVLYQLPRLIALPLETAAIQAGLALVYGLLAGWMMMKTRHVLAPAVYRAVSIWLTFLIL